MTFDELLRAPALWKEVAVAFHDYRDEEWDELDLIERIRYDIQDNYGLEERLRCAIDKKVVSRLSCPPAITSSELARIAVDQLAGLSLEFAADSGDEDVKTSRPEVMAAKQRFCALARAQIVDDLPGEPDFHFGQWQVEAGRSDSDISSLWSSENFTLNGELLENSDKFPVFCKTDGFVVRRLKGYLVGSCSESAMVRATNKLKPIFESAAKTARLSALKSGTADERQYGGFWRNSGPPLDYFIHGDGAKLFRTCVDSVLTSTRFKGNDVRLSLRDAANSLIRSDSQTDPAMALSLSFASIESLVCFEKEKIVEQITSYVPTLLQPAGFGRGHKGEVLKELYGLRSATVHRGGAEVSNDAKEIVRRVASGVLLAVVRWYDFQSRYEHATSREELRRELHHASRDGKEVAQIELDMSELLPDDVGQEFDPFDLGKLI